MRSLRIKSISTKLVISATTFGLFIITVLTLTSNYRMSSTIRTNEEGEMLSETIERSNTINNNLSRILRETLSYDELQRQNIATEDFLRKRVFREFPKLMLFQFVTTQDLRSKSSRSLTMNPELRTNSKRAWLIKDKLNDWNSIANEALSQMGLQRFFGDKDDSFLLISLPVIRDQAGRVSKALICVIHASDLADSRWVGDKAKLAFVGKGAGLIYSTLSEEQKEVSHEIETRIANTNGAVLQFQVSDKRSSYLATFALGEHSLWFGQLLPIEIIEAPFKEASRWSIFTAGCFLSLSILVIFYFAFRVSVPIESLRNVISQIGQGDFDVRAAPFAQTGDEIQALAESVDQMVSGLRERDKIKKLFAVFHGAAISEDLMSRELNRGGHKKEIIAMFSDIRGFTTLCERSEPEVVVSILNRYFDRMVGAITRNNGVVDKFVGDAIVAVWGITGLTEADSESALTAGMQMIEELEVLNKELVAEGFAPLRIGIGLHQGPAVIGLLGSRERMEFTSIGDTMNTASRLESATKKIGCTMLISEQMANSLKPDSPWKAELIPQPSIALDGKVKNIAVYTLEVVEAPRVASR